MGLRPRRSGHAIVRRRQPPRRRLVSRAEFAPARAHPNDHGVADVAPANGRRSPSLAAGQSAGDVPGIERIIFKGNHVIARSGATKQSTGERAPPYDLLDCFPADLILGSLAMTEPMMLRRRRQGGASAIANAPTRRETATIALHAHADFAAGGIGLHFEGNDMAKIVRSVLALTLALAIAACAAPPPPAPLQAPPPPPKHKLDAKTQLETGRTY
jgi:hypothetical protein